MSGKFIIDDTEISFSLSDLFSESIAIESMPYSYTVEFVDELQLSLILDEIKLLNSDKHFIFIDHIVADLYAPTLFNSHPTFEVIAEESNKVLPVVTDLLDKLLMSEYTKKEMFLSAGGGITQDLSAFVRAIYKRGIDWTYIPTTLLAMGDSCIGAKSCLNYGEIKNSLGLFSSPKKVYIYKDFLKTLKHRDILSGYGEILKLSIVGGVEAIRKFDDLTKDQQGDSLQNIDQLLKLSLLIKKAVIEIDEFENDVRKALNYGHTVGHAIEPLVNYQIPHGIAVSIGMIVENLLASEFGKLPADEAARLNGMIIKYIDEESLQFLKEIPIDKLISAMKRDKKALSDAIYIAVPYKIGFFQVLKISPDAHLEQFLKKTFHSFLN